MASTVKGVKEVRIFERTAEGLEPVARLKEGNKKRKRTKAMRNPEKNTRVFLNAARTLIDELDDRHDRSSRKRKDGWVQDGPSNLLKAHRQAGKKLRKLRVI